MLLVGGRFACERCLVRGVTPGCRRCGLARVDLGSKDGAAVLAKALDRGKLVPIIAAGRTRRWWARRSIASKIEWIFSLLAAVGITLGVFMSLGAGQEAPGIAAIPMALLFFALVRPIVFLGALVLRLAILTAALVVCLVALIVSVVVTRKKEDQAKAATWLLDRSLRILDLGKRRFLEPLVDAPETPSLEATLEAPLTLLAFSGATGDMRFDDGVIDAFEARDVEGRIVRIELDAGTVTDTDLKPIVGTTVLPRPSWLAKAPVAKARGRVIASGTRIDCHGGEWSEIASAAGGGEDFRHPPTIRLLRGTPEHPLSIAFRDAALERASTREATA